MPRVLGFLDDLRHAMAPAGLNHVGVVTRARYDAAAPPDRSCARIHPPTRSIVVLASGGPAHWRSFLDYVAGDPVERLARRAHPLDDFCVRLFEEKATLLVGCHVVHPTFRAPIVLDFMRLGELSGLGRPSEIGILLDERFGLWFGLRAAVFAPHDLPNSTIGPRLCDDCAAPCLAAGRAALRDATGHRSAREACPVAPAARYDELARVYHYDTRTGRRLLCEHFGVVDEVAW